MLRGATKINRGARNRPDIRSTGTSSTPRRSRLGLRGSRCSGAKLEEAQCDVSRRLVVFARDAKHVPSRQILRSSPEHTFSSEIPVDRIPGRPRASIDILQKTAPKHTRIHLRTSVQSSDASKKHGAPDLGRRTTSSGYLPLACISSRGHFVPLAKSTMRGKTSQSPHDPPKAQSTTHVARMKARAALSRPMHKTGLKFGIVGMSCVDAHLRTHVRYHGTMSK